MRHHAIGVNYLDVYYRTGFYPAPALPFTPGNEGAGEVVAVGNGVKDFKPGDRVAYVSTLGSYAEERNVDVKHLVNLPEGDLLRAPAAAMMLKGLTAQYLLRQTYRVKAGDTILVHAAAGGVGQILCQWGKALGATVIGTVGSEDKGQDRQEGRAPKHVILYRDEDFAARVKRDHQGREMRRRLRRRRQGDLSRLARLPARRSACSRATARPRARIEAFNLALLAQKGSLFATRPTLFTFLADRARLDTHGERSVRGRRLGRGEDRQSAERAPLAEAARMHAALESRQTTGSIVLHP